jgi:hypothetical protein
LFSLDLVMLIRIAIFFASACVTFAVIWFLGEHGGEAFAFGFYVIVAWILGFGSLVVIPLARSCSSFHNSVLQFGTPIIGTFVFLACAAALGVALAGIANHTLFGLP